MCFSAGASFGAGVVLLGAGVMAVKRAKPPVMRLFAATPILFGVHQLVEGVLWLSLKNPEWGSLHEASLYTYGFISQVLWPAWIPFVVWLMEPDKVRKQTLYWFMLGGGAVSVYFLYCLAAFGVSASAESCHIQYTLHFPAKDLRRVMYFLTTLLPIFLSTLRYMKLLGGTMLGSLILSYIFYAHHVISVWCFFAALLSILVHLVIASNRGPGGKTARV